MPDSNPGSPARQMESTKMEEDNKMETEEVQEKKAKVEEDSETKKEDDAEHEKQDEIQEGNVTRIRNLLRLNKIK